MALVCADFMTFYKRSEIGAVGWVLPVLSIHAFIPTHSLRVPRSMCAPRHRPASSRVALVALYAARDLMLGEELFVHYGEDMGRDYEVGEPAPDLFKYDIPARELPCNWSPPLGALRDGYRSD